MMPKIKKIIKKISLIIILILLILLILIPVTLAVNDPGHDTLYIEQQGDSELNGSLNITLNATIKGGRTTLSSNIDLFSNGNLPTINKPTITGTTNDLYLDAYSGGIIYLNKQAASGTVAVGAPGQGLQLNVSGALNVQNGPITVGGVNVCLFNGTGCPSSLSGANISANGGSAGYIAQFQNGSILNNSIIIQTATGIGISTASPTQKLDVNGSINISSTTGTIYAPRIFQNGTQVAGKGNCAAGLYVQNITNGTPECATPTATSDGNNYTTGAGLNVTGSTLQIITNITGRTSITNSITMNDTTRALAGYINLTGALTCLQNLSLLSTGLSYSSITIPIDQNNYTASAGFNGAILNINITGRNNVTATITNLGAGNITAGTFATGDYAITGNLSVSENITSVKCITFNSGGKICSGS